jgi:hypothetical protein
MAKFGARVVGVFQADLRVEIGRPAGQKVKPIIAEFSVGGVALERGEVDEEMTVIEVEDWRSGGTPRDGRANKGGHGAL